MARMPRPLGQAGQSQWRHQPGTSACLLHQIPHSPSHRLMADRLSHQHWCRQVREDHLAGKDRHNYGHKMTPGGLQALLPSRLTEITDWGEDKIWPGLDSYLEQLLGSP